MAIWWAPGIQTHIHSLIVGHSKNFPGSLGGIDEPRYRGVGEQLWVDNVIACQPKSIISEDTRLPQLLIRTLHALV